VSRNASRELLCSQIRIRRESNATKSTPRFVSRRRARARICSPRCRRKSLPRSNDKNWTAPFTWIRSTVPRDTANGPRRHRVSWFSSKKLATSYVTFSMTHETRYFFQVFSVRNRRVAHRGIVARLVFERRSETRYVRQRSVDRTFLFCTTPWHLCALESVLMAFSIPANLKRLTYNDTKTAEFADINFLKVMSCMIILNGHRLMYTNAQPLYSTNTVEEVNRIQRVVCNSFADHVWLLFQTFEILLYAVVHNGPLVVDVFFVISGFLTYFGVYNELVRSKRFNMPSLLLWRWCRLVVLIGSDWVSYVLFKTSLN